MKKHNSAPTAGAEEAAHMDTWSEEEKAQYIVKSIRSGYSPTSIANDLNEQGQRDAKGRKWNKARVDEVYAANEHQPCGWGNPPPSNGPPPNFHLYTEHADAHWRQGKTPEERERLWFSRWGHEHDE
jgi:hypothetical protein